MGAGLWLLLNTLATVLCGNGWLEQGGDVETSPAPSEL